jgi:hypothetical protein
MAELADAADSKSADLRVLGVQLPLPAPTTKPALDAGSRHVDGSTNRRDRIMPDWAWSSLGHSARGKKGIAILTPMAGSIGEVSCVPIGFYLHDKRSQEPDVHLCAACYS